MSKDTRLASAKLALQASEIDEADSADELLDSLRRRIPCKAHRFEEKATIYREGEDAENVLVVLRGMVKLLVHLPNGKVRIVRLQVAGDWLAVEGLGKNQAYEHTAVAVGEVELAQFPAARLYSLLQEDSDLYAALLQRGCEHLEKADKWIAEFSTGSIKARLAHLIEFLGKLESDAKSNTVNLLTVNETADVLGVTPESASRFLAEFKREGVLIQIEDNDNWHYRIDKSRLEEAKKD